MTEEKKSYEDASIFDALDENVYIVEPVTMRMLFMNRKGRQDYGITNDDYIGQPCFEVLRDRTAPCIGCPLQSLTPEHCIREVYNERIDRHFKVIDQPIRYKGKDAQIELAVDITDYCL